jgi:glycerol-3-phosphate acyltransferase PlsY
MLLGMLFVCAGYLLGSVSSAIIVCRMWGVADPREVGSRNPGATNVLRHAGKSAAALTLLGDAAKGLVPVMLASASGVSPAWVMASGLAAFLGHLYPLYYGFSGGKGVATFIGVTLGFDYRLGLGFIAVWLIIAFFSRYSSLAALVATAAMPIATFALGHGLAVTASLCAICAGVFWRHRGNLRALRDGSEKRIGQKI